MTIEVMKQALEALELYQSKSSVQMFDVAITALRAAIEQAQSEQEPRRLEDQEKCHCDSPTWCKHYNKCNRKMLGLPPAPRQWQGLTKDELLELWESNTEQPFPEWFVDFKRAYEVIEAKLKEKNA